MCFYPLWIFVLTFCFIFNANFSFLFHFAIQAFSLYAIWIMNNRLNQIFWLQCKTSIYIFIISHKNRFPTMCGCGWQLNCNEMLPHFISFTHDSYTQIYSENVNALVTDTRFFFKFQRHIPHRYAAFSSFNSFIFDQPGNSLKVSLKQSCVKLSITEINYNSGNFITNGSLDIIWHAHRGMQLSKWKIHA